MGRYEVLISEAAPRNNDALQCGYDLLRAFAGYAAPRRLRFALAAGTLLGAMRNQPPGFLQWEHDADIYMPARDAARLLRLLLHDCPPRRHRWRSQQCATLQLRGLVDRAGDPCCGFGFKLYNRLSDACELDVLVLVAADAPYMHGETPFWPPWAPFLASPYHRTAATWYRARAQGRGSYYVVAEDTVHKALMTGSDRWCNNGTSDFTSEWAWCGGPPLSFFHAEYFAPGELFPIVFVRFHGLRLPVPHRPWGLLHRAYGHDCAYVARLNELAGATADLRRSEHARLRAPAAILSRDRHA